ncbi:hypothetical protein AVEN_146053-1 [Araneus ventricosus]|uniref:Uncharacterized protein n=1 Tax=Araneus ventricosus TaxID=182803 RepID=A0A4Y2GAQ6_ARAVE|nr:hypothetical protein AVEN_146053-1 [Araneus ventricosus]
MQAILMELNLNHISVIPQPTHSFPPWKVNRFYYLNPFENFSKPDTADAIYQKLFSEHRSHYHSFTPVYTDGSKSTNQTSFAVIFPNNTYCFKLHPSCFPLRGTSSSGVTGFTTPRYPSVCSPFEFCLLFEFQLFSSFPRG